MKDEGKNATYIPTMSCTTAIYSYVNANTSLPRQRPSRQKRENTVNAFFFYLAFFPPQPPPFHLGGSGCALDKKVFLFTCLKNVNGSWLPPPPTQELKEHESFKKVRKKQGTKALLVDSSSIYLSPFHSTPNPLLLFFDTFLLCTTTTNTS